MLQLKDIVKIYPAGDNPVEALKGINLSFRDNEFVSILGQSGCGKTTMLNIIGGLDQYTSGDLIINGKSTKEYKDRDWDSYRNHSIGFVFQSYNLIPHQNVLSNVEIALSLSGVSKKERRERAVEALKKVGLGDQLKKKPAEMSGGQMQRVAIARAIVNNPDIILADEPTGALDTETSVQVMEILKEIAKDKLVIMVTHNPELAEQYSTRIVRMLDGKITGDTAPFSEEEQKSADKLAEDMAKLDKKAKKEASKSEKKPSMSFATSFGLSLKNLITKKGRTILTSFAGSIGIIGIALIYSVSQGTNNFINDVQEDTISAYPLEIQAQTVDLSTLLNAFVGDDEQQLSHDKDAVYQRYKLYDMMNSLIAVETQENDLSSFKAYIEEEKGKDGSKFADALSGVQYSYNLNLAIYTKNVEGKIIHSDTTELMSALFGQFTSTMYNMDMSGMSENSQSAQIMGSSMTLWSELLPGANGEPTNPVTHKQYDIVYGRWPESYDEIVLFLDENNELDDYTLYALGLKTEEEITSMMNAALNKQPMEYSLKSWSYEEICALEFRSVLPSSCWSYDATTGLYTDLRSTDSGLQYLYDNALSLKVVGIVRPNEDAVSTSHHGTIGYTHMLTEYIINESANSDAITAQLADPTTDITSGLRFKEENAAYTTEEKAAYFRNYVKELDDEGKADIYVKVMSIPSEAMIQEYVDTALAALDRETMEAMMMETMTTEMGMDPEQVRGYISQMSDEDMKEAFAMGIREQYLAEYSENMQKELSTKSKSELAKSLDHAMDGFDDEYCAGFYDSVIEFSPFTYDYALIRLGCLDLDEPASIRLYAATFEDKDTIVDCIDDYNDSVPELQKLKYTDYVGILMSSVTTIINAITYVLIAFVAVSLIVSSIMIGVITLISVQERTKEIGILRSLGASKKNVSSMFNAETVIIGFTSGLLGVLITYVLLIPINIIVHNLTKLNNLTAVLPIVTAIILIIISVLLTLIAGIIPSRSAAKKDPVVALRTE
ncbi:MAG: ABC transporter ATP-binding protein/permease [Clostridiales bacterium]|nr:ABC transporter ATP-binding protein/permease [Clostridiales bacterium]